MSALSALCRTATGASVQQQHRKSSLAALPEAVLKYLGRFVDFQSYPKLLAACSALHTALAPVFWRWLVVDEGRINSLHPPPSAWARYGQLVHSVSLHGRDDIATMLPLLPNLTWLRIGLGMCGFGGQDASRLSALPQLRKVTFNITHADLDVVERAIQWATTRAVASSFDTVTWILASNHANFDDQLAMLVDGIDTRNHFRFDLAIDVEKDAVEHVAAAAPLAVSLSVACRHTTVCSNAFLLRILGAPDAVFPHLDCLSINFCCSRSTGFDAASINPLRFPALVSLSLNPYQCQAGSLDASAQLSACFAHPWPKLRDLALGSNQPGAIPYNVLDKTPSARSLVFGGAATADVGEAAARLLRLSKLEVLGSPVQCTLPAGARLSAGACLRMLTHISFHSTKLTEDVVRFTAVTTSNLRLVELTACRLPSQAVSAVRAAYSDRLSGTVRVLWISFDFHNEFLPFDYHGLISLLPGLETINHGFLPDAIVASIQRRYPAIVIQRE